MKKLILLVLTISLLSPTVNAADICECSCESLTKIETHIEIESLYPSPLEGEEERITLLNTGSTALQLENYTLEDSTGNPWTLNSEELSEGESITIMNFDFQLNNGGDHVILKTIHGDYIDELSYDSSESGEIIDKNSKRIEEETESDDSLEELIQTTPDYWPNFSEALPNPEGTDSTEEWIELFNPYEFTLTLNGLYLDDQDGGSSPYSLEGTINSYEFLLISVEDSGVTLNNSIDSIRLLGVNQETLWEINYENPEEEISLIAITDSEQAWTSSPTPGYANEFTAESDQDEESYENGDLSEEVDLSEIYPNPEGADANNEWIEITNGGDEPVNLGNWTLDDGDGGSDPYIIPDETIIEAGETLIFYRSETDIALNNSNEVIELKDYTGEVMDEISYEKSKEGLALAKIEIQESSSTLASLSLNDFKSSETWQWVSPSPGELNPMWIQFTGAVHSFDGAKLILDNGIELLEFQVDTNSLIDEWLYQTGNKLLVNTSLSQGIYQLKNTELLEQFIAPSSEENTPSSSVEWILSLSILGLWFGSEQYKKMKEKRIRLQSLTG